MLHKYLWVWVIVIIVIMGFLANGLNNSIETAKETPKQTSEIINDKLKINEEPKKEIGEATIKQEIKVSETLSQQNAVRRAEQYLKVMPFSKSGLIEQLEFDGFSHEDATYAVNKLNVDWKEQAVKKAKTYLDVIPFSRSELINQLEFDGFTTEEATYAVDQLGF